MNDQTEFPMHCFRGLRSSKWVQNGEVKADAFIPDKNTAERREDGRSETSINFDDDDTVLPMTRADGVNAKYGVARLLVSAIDFASLALGMYPKLSYERDPKPSNKAHGNILFEKGLRKAELLTLAAILAVRATIVQGDEGAAGASGEARDSQGDRG